MYQKNPMGIELSCANFPLFQVICLAGDHVSENDLTWLEHEHFYISVDHTLARWNCLNSAVWPSPLK